MIQQELNEGIIDDGSSIRAFEDGKDIRRKVDELKMASKTRKSVHVTYVTSYGLARDSYAKDVQHEVTLDDFFVK